MLYVVFELVSVEAAELSPAYTYDPGSETSTGSTF